jgi:hypothetical protein
MNRSYVATPRPVWLGLAFAPGLLIVFCLVLYPLALALWTSLGMDKGGAHQRQLLDAAVR